MSMKGDSCKQLKFYTFLTQTTLIIYQQNIMRGFIKKMLKCNSRLIVMSIPWKFKQNRWRKKLLSNMIYFLSRISLKRNNYLKWQCFTNFLLYSSVKLNIFINCIPKTRIRLKPVFVCVCAVSQLSPPPILYTVYCRFRC